MGRALDYGAWGLGFEPRLNVIKKFQLNWLSAESDDHTFSIGYNYSLLITLKNLNTNNMSFIVLKLIISYVVN